VIDKKPKAKITIEVPKEVTTSTKKSAEPVKSTRESKAKQSPRKPTKSVEQTHDRKTKKKEQITLHLWWLCPGGVLQSLGDGSTYRTHIGLDLLQ